jgi:hypothetical protein
MFDHVLMNPPYSVGNKITSVAIETCCKCVCLMPLGQYKSNGLYRHVEDFRLADPKVFEGADITNNLCICILQSHKVDRFKTYEEMEIISFNHKATPFFNRNKLLKPCFRTYFETTMSSDVVFDNTYTFATTWRISVNNVQETKTGWDYKYNVTKELKDIPVHDRKDGTGKMYMAWILDFGKGHETSCKNFNTWWWYKGKHGLCAFLIKSLNKKSGTIEQAIPRIDWENINDHPLWKEGKYDEAVLDVMGLKWNDDKDGVIPHYKAEK